VIRKQSELGTGKRALSTPSSPAAGIEQFLRLYRAVATDAPRVFQDDRDRCPDRIDHAA